MIDHATEMEVREFERLRRGGAGGPAPAAVLEATEVDRWWLDELDRHAEAMDALEARIDQGVRQLLPPVREWQ